MHILFADDTRDTRDLYALGFALAHHTVRLAFDGVQAIAAVERDRFDVIVLDVQMPVVNGWQALGQIRALPNGRDVPIALFSAVAQPGDLERAQVAGAATLIHKPIMPNVLLMVLKELVARGTDAKVGADATPIQEPFKADTQYFTAAKIAAYLEVNVETFLHMANHGNLKPIEIEGQMVYKADELRQFLADAGVMGEREVQKRKLEGP